MASNKIDILQLRTALDAILDHVTKDLGVTYLDISENEDFYWEVPAVEMYNTTKSPASLDTGRLTDDLRFASLVSRGSQGDVSYSLVHIAPLLRYIGEKVKS